MWTEVLTAIWDSRVSSHEHSVYLSAFLVDPGWLVPVLVGYHPKSNRRAICSLTYLSVLL